MKRVATFLLLMLTASTSLAEGFADSYTAMTGDLNSDGKRDIYLKHNAKLLFADVDGVFAPIVTNPTSVGDFVLLSAIGGTFAVRGALTTSERQAVRQWPASAIRVVARDVNA